MKIKRIILLFKPVVLTRNQLERVKEEEKNIFRKLFIFQKSIKKIYDHKIGKKSEKMVKRKRFPI